MATRVTAFGKRPESVGVSEKADVEFTSAKHQPAFVDKAVLDEAVDLALKDADPRQADSMRRLWAADQDTEIARAYFTDQVRKLSASRFAELGRKSHVVNEVLTQAEAAQVVQYAREYSLVFRNVVTNDHGFFSARRAIDHQIISAKYPSSMRILDFGGSVQHHVRNGNSNVKVIAPFDVDAKDPTRAALTRMALRRMLDDQTLLPAVREMARSVLAGDGLYHVPKTVQQADVKGDGSMAVHVYDVPLQDWPDMMHRCGVHVHEGCVHFVNDFFEHDEGEFEFSGARYEIDRKADKFRMRVGRGSSQWYEHRWSDFMKYGANQIMRTKHGTYSYQIVERRMDTIFYRILRVDSAMQVEQQQVYALPSVPMVEVHGFEVFSDRIPGRQNAAEAMMRRTYIFPQALWERMLAHASAEADRGGLSYEKMFNFYRTVVPRQSINSVHVSGGQKVDMMDVPALVVMSSIVAYANILLMQRATRALTDEARLERERRLESTLFKGFSVFAESLVTAGHILYSPFTHVAHLRPTDGHLNALLDKLVTWRPQVHIRPMSSEVMLRQQPVKYKVQNVAQLSMANHVNSDFLAKLVDLAKVDSAVAKDVLAACGDGLTSRVRANLETLSGASVADGTDSGVGTSVESDRVEKPGVTEYYKGIKLIRRRVFPLEPTSHVVAWRRNAVVEALDECRQETKALLHTCERVAREVMRDGKPNVAILRKRCEEFYNPDVWYVNNGVIGDSVLNPVGSSFSHGGVYLISMDGFSQRLQPVLEQMYVGNATQTGKPVEREHSVLPVQYTGYALVLDGLKIFNGPAVAESLARVLEMDDELFNFRIVCHQGPPGCGKTTAIANDGNVIDTAYLTPTRVARDGLAEKLKQVHKIDNARARMICRTSDSLLVNYSRLPDAAKSGFKHVRADEYVLGRAGKWIACAVLLGVVELHAYGDPKQISHKPRVTVGSLYLELQPQILEQEFLGFRGAAEVCAAYSYVYGNEIRTTVKESGIVKRVHSLNEVTWKKSSRLLSMYQADKLMLSEIANVVDKQYRPLVNTVHEAQGSDCDQVVIYNGEVRKRGAEDTFYLYGLLAYCLVAISRARFEVIYVKQSEESDVLTEMISYSQDPRRVEACKDVSTQGASNIHF